MGSAIRAKTKNSEIMFREYVSRFYREQMRAEGLIPFQVKLGESDLYVWAEEDLFQRAHELLLHYREELERFISKHPIFEETLAPYQIPSSAPDIVQAMSEAAGLMGVGPMASVAGAIADFVGKGLLAQSAELIVENGGDLFIASRRERKVGIFAGKSPLSGRLALSISPCPEGLGVCTSSATVGPSLSLGRADAALVVAECATLADAAASALGNRVARPKDIQPALDLIMEKKGIIGALVILGEYLGLAGDISLAPVGIGIETNR